METRRNQTNEEKLRPKLVCMYVCLFVYQTLQRRVETNSYGWREREQQSKKNERMKKIDVIKRMSLTKGKLWIASLMRLQNEIGFLW